MKTLSQILHWSAWILTAASMIGAFYFLANAQYILFVTLMATAVLFGAATQIWWQR